MPLLGHLTQAPEAGLVCAQMTAPTQALESMLSEVLAPLVEADGGELYFVSYDKETVALHVGGSWNGSPAVEMATERIITPAVVAIEPGAKVAVTYGWSVPDGAKRITPE